MAQVERYLEAVTCPICGSKLEYTNRFFNRKAGGWAYVFKCTGQSPLASRDENGKPAGPWVHKCAWRIIEKLSLMGVEIPDALPVKF